MAARRWGGSASRRARAHFAPLVAAGDVACAKCGLPVTPEHRWHVGHQLDRALGGADDLSNYWPEHGSCNEAAGGRLAQALRGAPRRRRGSSPALVPRVERRSWT